MAAVNEDAKTIGESSLALEDTGERMLPDSTGRVVFWEHVHRYAFACRLVSGKRVLDIACGEGYGSAAIQRAGAAHVIGVDISEAACAHAADKYGIDARVGSAEQIPLPDSSVDVVVSFETIEHVPAPGRFLDECARVLAPVGRLIISTPNKDVYSAPGRPRNPFHCSEMTEHEFLSALRGRFLGIELYSQHLIWAPLWSPRTLSADETPWDWIYPLKRLRRSARFRLSDPSPEERSTVVEQILNPGRTRFSALFPYALQPRRNGTGEQPLY
ncbi:MAG TPA: class I SAM-dependent methyltransferase, partial [Nitrospira sp.]|nr:class I SAM-dependent methyltransferase [Nitrospira sp.]